MSTSIKQNLVVIAKADNKEDTAFYELLLKYDSHIQHKAQIYMFPSVDGFTNFLKIVPRDFKFYLFIHSGVFGSNPSFDRINFTNQLKKLPYYKKLHHYFTSRDPSEKIRNDGTIYAAELVFDEFTFEPYTANVRADLLSEQDEQPQKAVNASERPIFSILTALYKDEFQAFNGNMNTRKLDSKNTLKGAFLPSKNFAEDYRDDIILAWQQDMGSIDAAAFSSMIIAKHNPKFLIMGGVCGGREDEVKLYDIIIPKNIHDYMSGKFKKGEFIPRPLPAEPNPQLIGHLIENEERIKENMRKLAKDPHLKNIVDAVTIHIKNYACGPWVVKTKGKLLEIATHHNDDIVGLEMESLGVIRSSNLFSPYDNYGLIVKSVMDFTDENKSDGNKGTIKATAASVSYLCVRAMLPVLLELKDSRLT